VNDLGLEFGSYSIGGKVTRPGAETAPPPPSPPIVIRHDDDPYVNWSNRATLGGNTSIYNRERTTEVREEIVVRRRARSRSLSSDESGDYNVNDNSKAKGMGDVEFTDHQLLLFSPRTYAFALKTKQWREYT
jgi:hypothetical protein